MSRFADQLDSADKAYLLMDATDLFEQITITENSNLASGYANKFVGYTTESLFNYANNLFNKDFSNSVGVGEANQLNMRNTIYTGMSNLLRGSQSNKVLGNNGGYSFQGLDLSAKAVKCKCFCLICSRLLGK